MKTNKITTLCAAIAMMTAMAGCTGNDMKKEAEGLLDNAREQFGKGQIRRLSPRSTRCERNAPRR